MEGKIINKQGETTEELNNVCAFLFEGNDAVESYIFDDEKLKEVQFRKFESNFVAHDWDMYSSALGENNISIFFDPNFKVFNIISCSEDKHDGKVIGTTVSFINEDYDKFINLMRKIIKYEDNKA